MNDHMESHWIYPHAQLKQRIQEVVKVKSSHTIRLGQSLKMKDHSF